MVVIPMQSARLISFLLIFPFVKENHQLHERYAFRSADTYDSVSLLKSKTDLLKMFFC